MSSTIEPRSGVAFTLNKGDILVVTDPLGEQVADLLAFKQGDIGEVISSGRTLDYAARIFLTTGDRLYSNRSNVMLEIIADDVGRHDFLLTPCSKDTFRIIYGDTDPHQGCFGSVLEFQTNAFLVLKLNRIESGSTTLLPCLKTGLCV